VILHLREIIYNKDDGFSLIEILIAISILAVGLMGILSIFPIAGAKIRNAQMQEEALKLAQAGIEKARSLNFDNLNDANLVDEPYGTIEGYHDYKRDYTVLRASNSEANEIPDVRMVTVTVSFRVGMKSDASEVDYHACSGLLKNRYIWLITLVKHLKFDEL